jgi:ElaB/YqjD/DUF883 family membrane-anchored ribosome-binding protein
MNDKGVRMANKRSARISGARSSAHRSVDRFMDNAEDLEGRRLSAIDSLKDRAQTMKDSFNGYVQDNPGKTLVIAAGIGALVGAIITASMMRRSE